LKYFAQLIGLKRLPVDHWTTPPQQVKTTLVLQSTLSNLFTAQENGLALPGIIFQENQGYWSRKHASKVNPKKGLH